MEEHTLLSSVDWGWAKSTARNSTQVSHRGGREVMTALVDTGVRG